MAGKSFCQAAEIQLKQNTKHEAANMYNEAANSYKKASPEEALNCLNKSCEIYIDMVLIYCFILTNSGTGILSNLLKILFFTLLKIGSISYGRQAVSSYCRVI